MPDTPPPPPASDLYAPLNQALGQNQHTGGAAALHGLLAALVCCGTTASSLHDDMQPFDLPESADPILIEGLFARTERELSSEDYTFSLLLPDDDQDFSERLTALAHWCQGFILGLCQQLPERELSAECHEAIGDFQRITELTQDEPPPPEEQETAENQMLEVQEYVRIGVLLIYSELAELNHVRL